jgi:hypothetical protein
MTSTLALLALNKLLKMPSRSSGAAMARSTTPAALYNEVLPPLQKMITVHNLMSRTPVEGRSRVVNGMEIVHPGV